MVKQFIRLSEAARELGVSEAWLRRAEKSGRIPKAQRDLNKWRVYSQNDLDLIRKLLLPDLNK
jgi:DNA-binding transcriptional MerR regulator